MPRAPSEKLKVLGVLLLAGLAHGRLLGAGWRAPDLDLFERALALDAHSVEELAEVDALGAPLSNLELVAWSRAGPWRAEERPALPQRLLGVALLTAAAAGLGLFARRLLVPWTGAEHAGAAGFAAFALAAVHPAGTALIADAAAGDELRALALCAWAAALFLRGRQDRRPAWTALAWLLTLLASLTGELGWTLPCVLALSELVAAKRSRPRRERWRTAASTLFFFGLAAAVSPVLWIEHGGGSRFAAGLAFLADDPAQAARHLAGRARLLFLPGNPAVVGLAGALAAGAVLGAALQPGLVAARSAPRLWRRILGAWLLLLLCALVYGLDVPVEPRAETHAALLAAGAAVLVVGLAITSTALAGLRRALLVWSMAAVYAVLACAGGGAWSGAAEVASELRRDLAAARALHGSEARILVLDAPAAVAGVETLGPSVAALSHPELAPGAPAGDGGVVALSSAAFKMLAYEPELAALRAEHLVVLAPLAALPAAKSPALHPGGGRLAVRLGPSAPDGSPHSWRGRPDSRSPDLDLPTLAFGHFVVRADPRTDVSVARRAAWRTLQPGLEDGSLPCVWIETGDEPWLVAELGASLEWRLGDRARLVWIEGGATYVTEAELLPAAPPFDEVVKPRTDGADWLFPRATTDLVEAGAQRGRYVLSLLSLKDYTLRELPVERAGEADLRAAGAARAVAELARPVAWALEFRVEGVPLARASGRRVGRDGTVEDG
jgi:hypothetical protein